MDSWDDRLNPKGHKWPVGCLFGCCWSVFLFDVLLSFLVFNVCIYATFFFFFFFETDTLLLLLIWHPEIIQ